ncbi:RidA family protein [Leptolyngbya sp. 15MV]|nr:RidA family protein [Leptolyngbya sp. 15MV]
MTATFSNPKGVHTPGSRYSHVAIVREADRRLVISGQIGVTPDGTVLEGGPAQIQQAIANLRAILTANNLGPGNIVKLGVFLTDRALIPVWRAEREGFLGTHAPASTLLIVAGLADPRFVFEIEAEAIG